MLVGVVVGGATVAVVVSSLTAGVVVVVLVLSLHGPGTHLLIL